ncbi:LLM class F420-dependent oxidoreductase [Actinacidiphila soli]|uniref:LLM class F420-dependent oxidoreductase n=1 Tax=Actinacidiphila soli TaxID=2487275 RepID=UPI000FCA59DB|nr:LLM class F420-dependent oxidoreductase [Actinacidiphila soli]
MKFGISTFVTDEGITPTALGPALEQRGFDSLFLAEHTHVPASRETPYPGGEELPRIYYRTLDPFVTLSAIAPVTSDLLLGTGIALVVQRDPIITAKEVASLDLISGGRVIFGVGAGWNREEMRNHGTDPRTRGRLMDERIHAMIELWTKDKAEFHGEFVDFDPTYSWPKPVQKPHPPIYVGGASDRTFARVAEYGSAWLVTGVHPKELGPQIERMRQKAGADAAVVVYAAPPEREAVEAYVQLGVERVLFYLPTEPESETLRILDELAEIAAAYR